MREGGFFSVALSVTTGFHRQYPGVTWQCVHGARTFLDIVLKRHYIATVQLIATGNLAAPTQIGDAVVTGLLIL